MITCRKTSYLDFKLIMFLHRFLMTKFKNWQIIVVLTNSKTMLLSISNLDSFEKAKSETGKIILLMTLIWKLTTNGLKIVILKKFHLLMNKTIQNKVQICLYWSFSRKKKFVKSFMNNRKNFVKSTFTELQY